MADNVILNAGSGGATLATDDVAGIQYPRQKLSVGVDGAASDAIPVSDGLNTTAAGVIAVGIVAQFDDAAVGAVTENQFAPVRMSTRRALLVEGVASGTAQPVTLSGTVTVDGSGVTQPVSHAALTELAAAIDTEVQVDVVGALPAGNNNIGDVDVASLPALPTGANTIGAVNLAQYTPASGRLPIELDAAALAALETITVATLSAALPAGNNNIGDVDVASLPALAAGTNNIGDVDVLTVPADPFGVNADAVVAAGAAGSIQAKLRRATQGLEDLKSLVVLAAGDNNIGNVDLASAIPAGTNNIGDVDVLTLPALPAGTNNIGDVDVLTLPNVTLAAGTNTNEVVGDAAHDASAAGNPVLIGGYASAAAPSDVSGDADAVRAWHLRNGAQAMVITAAGALVGGDAANGLDVDVTRVIPGTTATALGKAEDAGHASGDTGVMVLAVRNDTPNVALAGTDLDYSPIAVQKDGAVRVAPPASDFAVLGSVSVKKYYTNAGAVTDGIVWSPAAGTRWYITDIFINVSAAATVTLEDDLGAGDSPVWKAELAANSGWSHAFNTPLFSGEDAADLLITTSAGNVYVMITGYEI